MTKIKRSSTPAKSLPAKNTDKQETVPTKKSGKKLKEKNTKNPETV